MTNDTPTEVASFEETEEKEFLASELGTEEKTETDEEEEDDLDSEEEEDEEDLDSEDEEEDDEEFDTEFEDEEDDEEFEDEAEEDDEEFESEFDAVEPTPRKADDLDAEAKVRLMVAAADAVRASDLTVLDLRGITIIADFFLICTGKSSIQLRAIADRMEEKLRDEGYRKLRVEGYQEATWILLDYGDVVAHVMAAEQREFYNLEGFWADAPRMEIEFTPEPATLAGARDSSYN